MWYLQDGRENYSLAWRLVWWDEPLQRPRRRAWLQCKVNSKFNRDILDYIIIGLLHIGSALTLLCCENNFWNCSTSFLRTLLNHRVYAEYMACLPKFTSSNEIGLPPAIGFAQTITDIQSQISFAGFIAQKSLHPIFRWRKNATSGPYVSFMYCHVP